MTHSLTFGSLLLTDDFPDADHGFVFQVLADGATWGVAQGVKQIVTSLLSDGDLTRTTRYGNREVSFKVQIKGPTLGAVAEGEAALRREVGRGNLLTWQPPDTLAVPTAFEVIDSEMAQSFDDLDELLRRTRTFTVTLTCAPSARSVDPVTVAGVPLGTYTPTLIDDAASATGWSATVNGETVTPTVSSGVLYATDATSPYEVTMTRTGSVDFSTTPYLVAEFTGTSSVTVLAGTGDTFPVVSNRLLTTGVRQIAFDTGGIAVPSLRFVATEKRGALTFGVANLERAAVPPQLSSKQITNVVTVGGTERTPASVHVESPDGTSILGVTLVHTSSEDGSGYSPPMRRWRIGGNTVTSDAATFSGEREPLHPNPVQYEVPTSSLPEGGYLLCAFIRVATIGKHQVYFSSVTELPPPNDGVGMGPVVNSTLWDFEYANTWTLVPLGIMSLPTVRTSAGTVVIGIQRGDASVAMDIDEAWLFRVDDDCSLTVANLPSPNLWLDSPGTTSSVPTVWMGASEQTRTHPGDYLISPGNHVLQPDGTAVFVATLGVDFPEVSATCYRRWHSNAAE